MKKVLSLILAVLLTCTGLTVFSAELTTGGRPEFLNFYYELEWTIDQNGVLTISDEVTALPSFGSSWGEYGPWRGNSAITKVIIPDTVTSIGSNLFENCVNLQEVVLPKSLEYIGENTFNGCKNVKKIEISSENTVFKTIDGVLFDGLGKILTWYPPAAEAKEYTIPEGTVEIADSAFQNSQNLEKVNFPDSITKIGRNAFSGAKNLDNLLLPDTIKYIGQGSFAGCEKLENIKMPQCAYVQGKPFYNTAFYKNEANWVENGLYIDNYLVDIKSDATEIEIKPDTISIAGGYTCPATITKITIPGSVKYIGDRAFSRTKRIEVCFNEGLEVLGDGAFYSSRVTSITLPDSLKVIGKEAFSNCSMLETINLGQGVEEIGENAFDMCYSLKEITIPDSVKKIGMAALKDCSELHTIRVGKGLEKFDFVYSCKNLSVIEISEHNPYLCAKDNVVFDKKGEVLIYYPYKKDNEEYTVPDGVKVIGESALKNGRFKKLTIPVSVEKIECFNNANFIKDIYYLGTKEEWEKVEICENNSTITQAMVHFNDGNVDNLYENLRFREEEDKVYIIGLADKNATDISIPGEINGKKVFLQASAFAKSNVVNVTLDESIKTIPSQAFSGCSKLENINLDYVEHIGTSAFEFCTSLKEINLLNIKSWSGITEKELDLEKKQLKLYYHQTLYRYDTSSMFTVFYLSNIETLRIKWPEENFDKEATMLPALFINCNVGKVIFENFTVCPSLAEFMKVDTSGNQHRFDGDMGLINADSNIVIYSRDEKAKEYAEKIGVAFVKQAGPEGEISVKVNGENLTCDTAPYIKNDRTMVPMRAIFEALGASVTWDDATKTATGVKDGVEVKIAIGENVLYKNGKEIALDAVAEITNSRTMVPVRAISEAFNGVVNWADETKTVEIFVYPGENSDIIRTWYAYNEKNQITYWATNKGEWVQLTYNEKGNEIKKQSHQSTAYSTYDKNDNCVLYEDSLGFEIQYTYDENGNVIKERHYSGRYRSEYIHEYTYNEKGQKIIAVLDDETILYEYDEKGNLVLEKDKDGNWKRKYTYDENNNRVYYEQSNGYWQKNYYDEDGKPIKVEASGDTLALYTYDEENKLVSYSSVSKDFIMRETYKYNEKGLMVYSETYTKELTETEE